MTETPTAVAPDLAANDATIAVATHVCLLAEMSVRISQSNSSVKSG